MREFRLFADRRRREAERARGRRIHDDSGYRRVREALSRQYDLGCARARHPGLERQPARRPLADAAPHQRNNRPLHEGAEEVLKHVARLWGFDVQLESIDGQGQVSRRWKAVAPRQP